MSQQHWNTVYQTKPSDTVSWYEAYPQRSVDTIQAFGLATDARIVDVGGGDSRLVDALLDLGFTNITVLDISSDALERASQVHWVVANITDYRPTQSFDVWHDRAAFHFLTTATAVSSYLDVAGSGIRPGGYLTIGTFSTNGPTQCSNLPVRQYSPDALAGEFSGTFSKLYCEEADHYTPTGTVQAFTFCQFERR
ncbi:MAG: class I SAM-dependent methyltransferase [Bacteroidetes bacterium]|nr:class I SAM-dependent methyltransferase [Fibrella sp.]